MTHRQLPDSPKSQPNEDLQQKLLEATIESGKMREQYVQLYMENK